MKETNLTFWTCLFKGTISSTVDFKDGGGGIKEEAISSKYLLSSSSLCFTPLQEREREENCKFPHLNRLSLFSKEEKKASVFDGLGFVVSDAPKRKKTTVAFRRSVLLLVSSFLLSDVVVFARDNVKVEGFGRFLNYYYFYYSLKELCVWWCFINF